MNAPRSPAASSYAGKSVESNFTAFTITVFIRVLKLFVSSLGGPSSPIASSKRPRALRPGTTINTNV